MDHSKLETLTAQDLKNLVTHCENLMEKQKATLEDYDAFLRCQQVLATRKMAKQGHQLSPSLIRNEF